MIEQTIYTIWKFSDGRESAPRDNKAKQAALQTLARHLRVRKKLAFLFALIYASTRDKKSVGSEELNEHLGISPEKFEEFLWDIADLLVFGLIQTKSTGRGNPDLLFSGTQFCIRPSVLALGIESPNLRRIQPPFIRNSPEYFRQVKYTFNLFLQGKFSRPEYDVIMEELLWDYSDLLVFKIHSDKLSMIETGLLGAAVCCFIETKEPFQIELLCEPMFESETQRQQLYQSFRNGECSLIKDGYLILHLENSDLPLSLIASEGLTKWIEKAVKEFIVLCTEEVTLAAKNIALDE